MTRRWTERKVRDGERLSGHGNETEGYPEIDIFTGKGPGGGALLCGIESFHWVDVKVKGATTELWFENKVCVAVSGGLVTYGEPVAE